MVHKFNIGQTVSLSARVLRPAASGCYEIVSLVPAPDNDPLDPRYRIRNAAEKHERVVAESELSARSAPAFS